MHLAYHPGGNCKRVITTTHGHALPTMCSCSDMARQLKELKEANLAMAGKLSVAEASQALVRGPGDDINVQQQVGLTPGHER